MSIKPMKYVLRALDHKEDARYPNVLFTKQGEVIATDQHRIHIAGASTVCSAEGVPTPVIDKDFAIAGNAIAFCHGYGFANVMARTALPRDIERAETFPKWKHAIARFEKGEVASSLPLDLRLVLKMAKLHASALRREALAKAMSVWKEKEDARIAKVNTPKASLKPSSPLGNLLNAKSAGSKPDSKPVLSDFPAVVKLSIIGLYLGTYDGTQRSIALADTLWVHTHWTPWWPAKTEVWVNLCYLDDTLRGHTQCTLEVPVERGILMHPIKICPQPGLTAYVMPMRK